METSSETVDRLTELLQQGMQAHREGDAARAEALYAQVLLQAPEQPDALHLTGLLCVQRQQYDEAADLISRAILANPNEAMYFNNLANVMVEQGRSEEAEAMYHRAVQLDSSRLDAFNNLAVLLSRRGEAEEAERMLLHLIEAAPNFGDARQNLVGHYLRSGKVNEALQACVSGLVVVPRSKGLRRLLGATYGLMGRKEEALALYQTWLEDEPDNPIPKHHLQACLGAEPPARAPDAYVRKIFDEFSNSFDGKLKNLGYRAPQLVQAAVIEHTGEPARTLDVLDAGCGTGLCGPLLAPYARRLDGVDLSQGMLARATARGGYDELVCGELVAFLAGRQAAYDLIVSADTLCYFGELQAFAAAAKTALRPGGLLVFTVEALLGEEAEPGFQLQLHGRYSHRQGYVTATLASAGLHTVEVRSEVLRQEAGNPVAGWLVCARHSH